MEREYILEDDYPLTESIKHYAKISNREDYKYKFIEIMNRMASEDIVYLADLKLIEKEFKCPVRKQIVRGSVWYLGCEINNITELNRSFGERRGKWKNYKIGFNTIRSAINATW